MCKLSSQECRSAEDQSQGVHCKQGLQPESRKLRSTCGFSAAFSRTLAWSLRRLPEHPATVRAPAKGERAVSDEELASIAPVHVIRKALPAELADELLQQLLGESSTTWTSSSWVVRGKEFSTPRTSAIYEFSNAGSAAGVSDDSYGREESRAKCEPSAALRRAREIVHALVRERRSQTNWMPTLALGNRYEDGKACVGWHSDFLNSLGPRPIIVGLSLGSSRRFCLRQAGWPDDVAKSIATRVTGCWTVFLWDRTCSFSLLLHGQGCNHTNAAQYGRLLILSERVEFACYLGVIAEAWCKNRSLHEAIIMWDDCQEEWLHSVPRQADSSIGKHPSAGSLD